MAKKIQGLDYRNISKIIKALDAKPKRKIDGKNAVTEAIFCGVAYLDLIKMKNEGWFDSGKDDKNKNKN